MAAQNNGWAAISTNAYMGEWLDIDWNRIDIYEPGWYHHDHATCW